MPDIKIVVATHKEYQMPEDSMYIPIQSGAVLNEKIVHYTPDCTGNNISEKNLKYSELTALYWLWKNETAEYKGLAHYRRHFSKKKNVNIFSTGSFDEILDGKSLEKLLSKFDIVVPKKRKYYIETIESHYEHTHYKRDLLVTEEILKELYPDYIESYHQVLKRKSAHMFNMFIMRDNYFDEYCTWLFSVLFELEKKLDTSDYSPFHARVFGRVSEILLDVWLSKNELNYTEVPVMFMEKQDWFEKVFKFLNAKNQSPYSWLVTIAVFEAVRRNFDNIQLSENIETLVLSISKMSLGIYILHQFIKQFLFIIVPSLEYDIWFTLIGWLPVLVMTIIAVYLIKKVPLLNNFLP